jgi:nitroimidazol reductase NimA-like FMN-containing flavoprotein (pyridoxamine 5'-phosphate oxidase superfamily)
MMDEELQLKRLLKELFRNQLFASLATLQITKPYNNLIAFASTEDLREILFVTKRATRKYANLLSNDNVAILIDSRSNHDSDFRNAVAVTVVGVAEEVKDGAKEELLNLYLCKHHGLEKFANSSEAALFKVGVKKYFIVRNFQDVMELKIEN